MKKENNLLTVSQFLDKHHEAWPSHGALRSIIFKAKRGKNKFQSAFIRVGRRVLVDSDQFWRCVEAQ